MDKNAGVSNSKTGEENVSQRSPLKDKNSLKSEESKTNTRIQKMTESIDSSKLNCIILVNENSELVKTLNFDSQIIGSITKQSCQLLKLREKSANLKGLHNTMFNKGREINKENTDSTYSRQPHACGIIPTSLSNRIVYNISDMQYDLLIKKVHIDFLYFQEVSRIGSIQNDLNILHQNSTKKKINGFFKKLNISNTSPTVAKNHGIASNGYSNSNAAHFNAVNNTYFKSTGNPDKYYQQIRQSRNDSLEESGKCDVYSLTITKINNEPKSETAMVFGSQNSNVSQKGSITKIDYSNEQIEPLDLTVQTPHNGFSTSKKLKTYNDKSSTSQVVLPLNSSITGKDSSSGELTQNVNSTSDVEMKSHDTRISANDSKALFRETEDKGKDIQQKPINDLKRPSVILFKPVPVKLTPSILTNIENNTINSEFNIGIHSKESNLAEKETVSSDILTTSLNLNGTMQNSTTEVKEINQSDEKPLPLLNSPIPSHDAASTIVPSTSPKVTERELCFDFLHFTTKWDSYQQDIVSKLTKNYTKMETLIKNTENVCRKIEEISSSTSRESNVMKKEFSQLQYYIGAAAKLKLTAFFKNVSEMQKDFHSLYTSMEQYNAGVDVRLARILQVLCEEK